MNKERSCSYCSLVTSAESIEAGTKASAKTRVAISKWIDPEDPSIVILSLYYAVIAKCSLNLKLVEGLNLIISYLFAIHIHVLLYWNRKKIYRDWLNLPKNIDCSLKMKNKKWLGLNQYNYFSFILIRHCKLSKYSKLVPNTMSPIFWLTYHQSQIKRNNKYIFSKEMAKLFWF